MEARTARQQEHARQRGVERLFPPVLQALRSAGLETEGNPDGHAALDKGRVGVLVGTGMGGLTGVSEAAACVNRAAAARRC